MAQRDRDGQDRRERLLVYGLWVAAAAIVVAGFLLRVIARLLTRADLRADLRIIGIALIAIGLAVGAIGWLSERLVAKRTP